MTTSLSDTQIQQVLYMASCNPDFKNLAKLWVMTPEEQLSVLSSFASVQLPKLQYEQTAIQQQITHFEGVLATINANIALLTLIPPVNIISTGTASVMSVKVSNDS